jgi:hypothetical protein
MCSDGGEGQKQGVVGESKPASEALCHLQGPGFLAKRVDYSSGGQEL